MIGFGNLNKNNDQNISMNKILDEVRDFKTSNNMNKGVISTLMGSGYEIESGSERLITFSQMDRMYKLNEWVRAIVDRTVNKATSFQPIISTIGKENKTSEKHKAIAEALIKNPNKTKESWFQLRKKTLKDILIYDAAGLAKIPTKRGGDDDILAEGDLIKQTEMEIVSIAGDTVYLNVDDNGRFKDLENAYYQKLNSTDKVMWYAANELIYMLDNPSAGYAYGLSPLETLVLTVTAELYVATYERKFFKNDATPRLAVMFDNMGTEPTKKLKRFQTYWEKELKGKPHRPFFAGTDEGSVRIEKIGLANKDMEFEKYSHWLLNKIMAVYKCQPFVLGDIVPTTGKLNSAQQAEQWHEDAIKPLLDLESYYYNTELIHPKSGLGFTDIMYHYPEAEFKKREKEHIEESQVKDGRLTINEWRSGRGMDEVKWGDAPWLSTNVAQPGTQVPGGEGSTKKATTVDIDIKKKTTPNFLSLK